MRGRIAMGPVIVVLVVSGIVVLVILPFIGSHLLFRFFGKTRGLDKLAEMYPASTLPAARVSRRQWVAVGGVNYANNADVGVTPQRLYL